MTYSSGGLIEAADYNGLSTSTNSVWSIGASDSGYGQTAVGTVTNVGGSPPALITATEWNTLITALNQSYRHQTAAAAPITAVSSGDIVTYDNNIVTTLASISTTQRLNAGAQGGTISTTNTSTVTWSDFLQFAWTITFGSHNQARYYFNAGGQLALTGAHPAGVVYDIDQLISDLCSDAGTAVFSSTNGTPATVSIAGNTYNGVSKIGGSNPGGLTISQNSGFYALTGAPTSVFTQLSDFVYHAYSAKYEILASYDGAGVISLTVLIDEIPNGAVVSTGTTSTLIVRPPDTTYLTDTWGTPTVGCTITSA